MEALIMPRVCGCPLCASKLRSHHLHRGGDLWTSQHSCSSFWQIRISGLLLELWNKWVTDSLNIYEESEKWEEWGYRERIRGLGRLEREQSDVSWALVDPATFYSPRESHSSLLGGEPTLLLYRWRTWLLEIWAFNQRIWFCVKHCHYWVAAGVGGGWCVMVLQKQPSLHVQQGGREHLTEHQPLDSTSRINTGPDQT